MRLQFVAWILLLGSITVPSGVSAQQLPAFLRVRASDVPYDAQHRDALSRQHARAAQLMAWGAGIATSLIPFTGVVHAMEQHCYDGPQRFVTKYMMYGVLGTTGIALAATGLARMRRLPAGYTTQHPLPHKQLMRAGVMSVVALASSLAVMSGLSVGELDSCGSS